MSPEPARRTFDPITTSPLNGAPAPDLLVTSHVTQTPAFFVRNHGVPPATPDGGTPPVYLEIRGLVSAPLTLGPAELAGLGPRVTVEATLQCAGNRRASLQAVRPIQNEVPWGNTAIGNATWTGVPLADVLAHAGVSEGATHVWFIGGDALSGEHAHEGFGASIPLEKALDRSTILADEMNGAPLAPDHGAPLRALVPGFIGARSVKWLREIRVERGSAPNHFQRAYSVYPPTVLAVPADKSGGRVLDEFPISSAFGDPLDGARVPAGNVTVRGWAIGSGERIVTRTEVSADGGATWMAARFLSPASRFVWRLWEADCFLKPGVHELVCRAVDDAGHEQPAHARDTWNVKGYVNNCWDRISVRAE